MTLDVGGYVTELEFAATSLQTESVVLWITRGLNDVPTVRGKDVVVPARSGRVAATRVADVMAIELTGWVLAQGDTAQEAVTDFRTQVEGLKALFDPTLAARTLSATLEDGSLATIDARVTPPILIEEVVVSHVAKVSIALESIDPYWVIVPAGS